MEEKDIEKIIKGIHLPQIELREHKDSLQKFLQERYFSEKRHFQRFSIFREGAIVFATFFAIFLLSFYVFLPQYTIAKARKLVARNPEIKNFLKKGGKMGDVRLADHKAFIVLVPKEMSFSLEESTFPRRGGETVSGGTKINSGSLRRPLVVEVDLKKKVILSKKEVLPENIFPLEKEKMIQDLLEKRNAQKPKIFRMTVPRPEIKLIIKENKIEPVFHSPRKVKVIYGTEEKQWEGEIDLQRKKVTKIQLIKE